MTDSTAPASARALEGPLQRTREEWSQVLRTHGIRPAKSMGQNFLVEPGVVKDIVDAARVQPSDMVVEVGPGMGILTRELLGRGVNLLAVELDRDLVHLLRYELGSVEQLTIVERDARYVEIDDWAASKPWKLVANLPYSTGTAIVRRFLELPSPPTSLTIMLQREVAERMVAKAPNLSLLSLAVQVYSSPAIDFIVPPDVFEPPPKVESAVVTLTTLPSPRLAGEDLEQLFSLATMAFQRKRKTISNGLTMGTGRPRVEIEEMLVRADIDPKLRPQAIDLESWLRLARESRA